MRLFIAIFPPKEYLDYFRDVLREFSKVKRNLKTVSIDQIHMTLKFVGPFVEESSKDLIVHELTRYAGGYGKAEITLGEVRFGFPKQSNPSILLARVERSSSLKSVSSKVHSHVKDLGLMDTLRWKDRHSDDFHFTLARLKSNATRREGSQIAELASEIDLEKPLPYFASEMYVMESNITNKGPSYRKLAKIDL